MVTTKTNLTTRRTRGRGGQSPVFIGIHTMEAPEGAQTAENVASYFKTVDASSHWCIDNDSRVRVVNDEDAAWTLPPVNKQSLNIEFAGYARQNAAEWMDPYSKAMLEIGAICAAEWVKKYGIPIRRLTDAQIARYEKGFVGHVDANRVFKKSSHWDPGPAFPWDYFLGRVRVHAGQAPATPTPIAPTKPSDIPSYEEYETMSSFITEALQDAYKAELGRAATEGELIPRRLNIARGRTTLKQEIENIDISVESNRYAVRALYKELLKREGNATEWDSWIKNTGNDPAKIRAAILNSAEYKALQQKK